MLDKATRQSLQSLMEKHQLTLDPVDLIAYEVDAGLNRGTPDGVVFPQSRDDVVRIVHWANRRRVPLVGRSAGTGLSGGAVPGRGGVVVSFSRMNHVIELDEVDRLAVVEPGVVNLDLCRWIEHQGYYYPPDPASQRACTIGGNIAENAGGPHCFKYGVTTNYISALEIVLADGQVVHTNGRACDYPEYDFTGLFTGSEGTLGLVTKASLRIIGLPAGYKTLVATFNSVEEAGEAVSAIIGRALVPAALEMMDKNITRVVEEYAHVGLPVDAGALLLIEVDGYPGSLDAQIEEIVAVLDEHGVRDLRICQTPSERAEIWNARKSAFGAIARISPAYFQVDGTVPRSRLAETLRGINDICDCLDLQIGYVFHAGDGNLHPIIPFDPADEDMDKRVHQAGDAILSLCVSKGGTVSGEHGIGLEKRKFMTLMYGQEELDAMREVKQVFDPTEILNPGKIFPEEPQKGSKPTVDLHSNFQENSSPQNEKEAAEVMRAAQDNEFPVVINGMGTLFPITGDPGSITLSTKSLLGIVELSPDDLYVTVRSGTAIDDLQQELASKNLYLPIHSPWKESSIGGIASAGFNCPFRVRYGAVRDQVLGVRVVLPDGRIVRFGRPVVKNVAGYDMVKLFTGAYGTLGLITELTLRLIAQPRARKTLFVPVDDLSDGLRIGQSLYRESLLASAMLLCKGISIPKLPPTPYMLVATIEGYPQDIQWELDVMSRISEGTDLEGLSGTDIWSDFLYKSQSHMRIGIPPKQLSEFLIQNNHTLGRTYIADIASGLIHVAPPPIQQLDSLRSSAISAGGYAVVLGDLEDSSLDRWGYQPETFQLMRALKTTWDPKGRLNKDVFIV